MKESNTSKNSMLLLTAMEEYISFLHSGTESKNRKPRHNAKYIDKANLNLDRLIELLDKNQVNTKSTCVDEVNTKMLEYVLEFELESGNITNYGYNDMLGYLSTFYKWIILVQGYQIENPFISFPRASTTKPINIITTEEFRQLLESITPENTWKEEGSRRKSMYRPWLQNAFILAFHTGARRQELVNLRFSDIVEDKSGNPEFIRIDDGSKYRQGHYAQDVAHFVTVELNEPLIVLINQLGYEKYRRTKRFLLAPDEQMSRRHLTNLLSMAFSHFYSKLDTSRTFGFSVLRRTYKAKTIG